MARSYSVAALSVASPSRKLNSTREARRADFSVAAWSVHHFVDMGIWPDRLVLRAIDQTGNVFDEVTLMPMAPLGAE